MFRRKPVNPNDMTRDTKKYLAKIEKFVKKNKCEIKYNSDGALQFVTDTTDGRDYVVTVNGESNIIWITASLSIDRTPTEAKMLEALNDLTETKNPVSVHLEYKYNMIFLTMCFNVEMVDKDIEAIMMTWWTYSEKALDFIVGHTGIAIEWNKIDF